MPTSSSGGTGKAAVPLSISANTPGAILQPQPPPCEREVRRGSVAGCLGGRVEVMTVATKELRLLAVRNAQHQTVEFRRDGDLTTQPAFLLVALGGGAFKHRVFVVAHRWQGMSAFDIDVTGGAGTKAATVAVNADDIVGGGILHDGHAIFGIDHLASAVFENEGQCGHDMMLDGSKGAFILYKALVASW